MGPVGAKGYVAEADYPKTSRRRKAACHQDAAEAYVTTTDCYWLTQDDEANLKQYVGSTGPVSVSIKACKALFHYKKGIITAKECSSGSGHVVQIVGYGEEDGVKYWKLRNSWSKAWGEEGYFRFEYGTDVAGVCKKAGYAKTGKILKGSLPILMV
jgi:C1A family cysteine protease